MTEPRDAILVPGDSELAQRLRAAERSGRPLTIAAGDATFRVYVEDAEADRSDPDTVARSRAGIRQSTGAWRDLVDAEALKRHVKERRRTGSRPSKQF